ncbi:2-nitropropane dioxygenase, NPD [Cupriavidus taiwanensis]|uniref:NAD(P)H-dependent flavin oxidoreductase n=1 Tax=Cupriavidus taiwanensis TaxID=164546 RepID=UPI000E1919AC|nr:nitronate monooxygenase [Cupriavidus taiwanensis]SOZ18007.1 2-nitropropane dioxygenase, NPD [Cupriavidus taiwanensis]SOZ30591.1 2-nitropropane dioxygenase, NPD [Cupriavidus taiwanensis]SOZ49863.1 2-nitropropane dioxygenase, NPD [Cupriavidus taiwanensis]
MTQTTPIADRLPLLRRLGIRTPIIQAPMAGVSTPALAAAVTNAGGLGSLGVGAMDAEAARQAIRETRALTSGPFNVNVFCHAPAVADSAREQAWLTYLAPRFAEFGATPPATLREIYRSYVTDDAMHAMLLEERPAVVSFHFGLPDAGRIRALRDAGIVLLASATSLDEARAIEAAGIDAIVAQGIEAGGHRGVFDPAAVDEGLGTFALVRVLATRTRLPVIAAGGIMDGAGITAALALGAQAAQLGTAFIACPETVADGPYREALLQARRPTVLTRAISGRHARGLANRFTELGAAADAPATPDYPTAYDAGKALHAAAKARGSADFAAQWAGQAVPLARALPAAQLLAALAGELAASARGLGALAESVG